MHTTTGRWKLGITLAFCTAVLWGLLPIALKLLLLSMDASTVTWYRFTTAAACLLLYALLSVRPMHVPSITRSFTGLMCVAIVGLTSNYIFYLKGLEFSSPSTTQVVIQLAPMLLLLGGLLIFKERFNRWQWTGLMVFLLGIGLFFNQQIMSIHGISASYLLGIALVTLASITWAAYALAQKQLLNHISSNTIMLCIYTAGGLVFFPLADPEQICKLSRDSMLLLIFCCANTLLAYGSFAEALNHLEASRVSAVLAITPILTIVFNQTLIQWFPQRIEAELLNVVSLVGACLMVFGSVLTALSKQYN